MVAPNLKYVQTIRGQLSVRQYADTTPANIIVNPANSGQLLRVKSLVAANVDPTTTFSISVAVLRSGVLRHVIKTADIQADASLPVILDQIPVYLEEGDSLQIYSSGQYKIHVVAMYEELADSTYTDIREDAEPSPGVSATVVPSSTSINEGSTVTFNVSTVGVANGTTLYWTTNVISGTINGSDFSDAQLTGSFTINSNAGSFTRTLSADASAEGNESFSISIRQTSTSGTVIATSATVNVTEVKTIEYDSYQAVSFGGTTTATATSMAFGTASSDRIIAVYLSGGREALGRTTAVTIGGVSATRAVDAYNNTDNFRESSIWYAAVPTGTSGNVVITNSNTTSNVNWSVTLYSLTGLVSSTPTTAIALNDNNTVSSSLAATISTLAGGVVLAGYTASGMSGSNSTWTNATEVTDNVTASGAVVNSTATIANAAGGNITVSYSNADNTVNRPALVIAAWF